MLLIQHGDRVLGVVLQPFQVVGDAVAGQHIGVGGTDEALQRLPRSGNDEIFQVDGAVEHPVLIGDVEDGDVVVVIRLGDELAHGLLDGEGAADLDEVGGHHAADLILLIRTDQLNVLGGLLVHQGDQLFTDVVIHLLQDVHGVIGVHVLDDVRRIIRFQFFQVGAHVVQIGEHFGHPFRI